MTEDTGRATRYPVDADGSGAIDAAADPATDPGMMPVHVDSDVTETLPTIARHFGPLLERWITAPHGNVAARRRDENDARMRQWRFYMDSIDAEPSGELDFACECDTPGCGLFVPLGLPDAETARGRGERLVAHGTAR
jgi:hypothetical protein